MVEVIIKNTETQREYVFWDVTEEAAIEEYYRCLLDGTLDNHRTR